MLFFCCCFFVSTINILLALDAINELCKPTCPGGGRLEVQFVLSAVRFPLNDYFVENYG